MQNKQTDYNEEEVEIEAIGISVDVQPIELYKVLKIANLVEGGGQAKHFISDGYVAVNGELETRKRRKIYDGDFFEFNQEYYVVLCEHSVDESLELLQNKQQIKNQTVKTLNNDKPSNEKYVHVDHDAKLVKSKPKSAKNKQEAKASTKTERDPNSGRTGIDFF